MSREHVISRCAFITEYVNISGHPSGLNRLHIDDLVAKVLCSKHNSDLSHLDQALCGFVNAAREMERLRVVREAVRGKAWPLTTFVVDACRLERALFKIIFNVAVVLTRKTASWHPPNWLAEVVFGARNVSQGCGMGLVARRGDSLRADESLDISFGYSEQTGGIHSALITLRGGWRFLCTWEHPLSNLGQLNITGEPHFANEDVLTPPRRVNDPVAGLALSFDWTGKWKARNHPNVVKLREKYRAPSR
jgi:hypothetical protein